MRSVNATTVIALATTGHCQPDLKGKRPINQSFFDICHGNMQAAIPLEQELRTHRWPAERASAFDLRMIILSFVKYRVIPAPACESGNRPYRVCKG